jgi:hypothetical protein
LAIIAIDLQTNGQIRKRADLLAAPIPSVDKTSHLSFGQHFASQLAASTRVKAGVSAARHLAMQMQLLGRIANAAEHLSGAPMLANEKISIIMSRIVRGAGSSPRPRARRSSFTKRFYPAGCPSNCASKHFKLEWS